MSDDNSVHFRGAAIATAEWHIREAVRVLRENAVGSTSGDIRTDVAIVNAAATLGEVAEENEAHPDIVLTLLGFNVGEYPHNPELTSLWLEERRRSRAEAVTLRRAQFKVID